MQTASGEGREVKRNISHQIKNKCPRKDMILSLLESVVPNAKERKGITSHRQKKESSEEGAQCFRLLDTLERVLCEALGWTQHSG